MIRRATVADLDAIVAMRCAMWDEHHADDRSDARLAERTRAYYATALANESVCTWISEGEGMVTLLVHDHPPRKHGAERRGYVTAVYVRPGARRRGVARALMEALVAHAQATNVRRLTLRTTEMARSLYESLGFRALEHLSIDFAPTKSR